MIIVFLGPTLSVDEAKKILPQAIYMPPARCGDVLQVTRLKPISIVIIDGLFETTAAIWHKEILFALEQGIQVWGGSSMGALRARELAAYGMRGVGKIVDHYFQHLTQDDAVAVLHGSNEENYAMRSEARVNMEYLISEAKSLGIISLDMAEQITSLIEDTFYPNRSWDSILPQVKLKYQIDLSTFECWLDANQQYYDLKKIDAIKLLNTVAKEAMTSSPPTFKMQRSAFFRAQYKTLMCQPLAYNVPGLPQVEQMALETKQWGELYKDLRRLARIFATTFALIGEKACLDSESRFAKVYQALASQSSHDGTSPTDYLFYLECLTSPTNPIYQHPEKLLLHHKVRELTAQCWWLVDMKAKALNLMPHSKAIQIYSEKFRLRKKLLTIEDTQQWLQRWNLDDNRFFQLMQIAARFHYLISQNNLDSLGVIDTIENVCWYHDVLYGCINLVESNGCPSFFPSPR